MIIVTGGAGFIGSNLVKGLNDAGYDNILIVDDLKYGHKCRNMNALDFIDYIDRWDFIDNLDSLRNDIDIIFHQGACSDTMEYDGQYMLTTNYDYSKELFNVAAEIFAPFIYASSAAVYGTGENGFVESRENEDPLNVYAFSKFLFDQYVRKNLSKVDNQVVGLRYFNVYGQQENHKGKMASPVYHFYNQLKDKGEAELFKGSQNFVRDFIYVDDAVDVNLYFLNNRDISGIFNCGTGKARSFVDIAEILIDLKGSGKWEEIPFPEKLKGKYQDFTKAELTRLREAGYDREFTTLEEGIKKYHYYLENNDGYLEYE